MHRIFKIQNVVELHPDGTERLLNPKIDRPRPSASQTCAPRVSYYEYASFIIKIL